MGLEYSYNKQFFGRVGYSHENFWKGNRRYVTLGAGFKLSIFSLDFAYCIATAPSNPLDATMRFTLGFDLVDYWWPVGDVGMWEHADTAIVTAEYKQQHRRRIFPYMSHSLKIERQI